VAALQGGDKFPMNLRNSANSLTVKGPKLRVVTGANTTPVKGVGGASGSDFTVGEVPPSVVVARRLGRYVAVLQRRFQDPAAVELADRGAVDLLPGRAALWDGRDTLLLAAFDLLL
jgi:hypothetical protein